MSPADPKLKKEYARVLKVLSAASNDLSPLENQFEAYFNFAEQLRQAARGDWALNILSPWKILKRNDARFNFALSLAYRDAQDLIQAIKHIKLAASLAPKNADIQFAKAQFLYEGWEIAAPSFRMAQRLAPQNLSVTKNMSLALASEGRPAQAIKQLEATLAQQPFWLEGYQQLTSLLATAGQANYDAPYKTACAANPNHLQLRLAWFHLLAKAKNWGAARKVIGEAKAQFGNVQGIALAEIYLKAETQAEDYDDNIFSEVSHLNDPGLDLCRVRFLLSKGEPEAAAKIIEPYLKNPNSRLFWPYMSLCWRLLGDERIEWLERDAEFIKAIDLNMSSDELHTLSQSLVALHHMQAPYLEQSVRGGTQTDRNLLLNSIKPIQKVRAKITYAVRQYVDALPPYDPHHPLLQNDREQIKFSGSWSVRLREQGFHSEHTHIKGWISSALYVSLPSPDDMGEEPAGFLRFGVAPPELGIKLPATKWVKPKAGRLVLFPSTTWHGTEPFEGGERLSLAFDIA